MHDAGRPARAGDHTNCVVMDELNKQTLITAVRLLQTYMFARSTDWDAQDRVNVAAGLGDLARLIENDKKLK